MYFLNEKAKNNARRILQSKPKQAYFNFSKPKSVLWLYGIKINFPPNGKERHFLIIRIRRYILIKRIKS